MTLKIVFVVLHVLTAAGYFGLGLGLTNWARAATSFDGGGPREALVGLGTRTVRTMTILLVATFVFALAAFLLGGGFRVYGPTYHASLGLIVLLLGVHLGLIAPAWRGLAAGRDGAIGRLGMGTGLAHLLWVVLLVLMFWPRLMLGA